MAVGLSVFKTKDSYKARITFEGGEALEYDSREDFEQAIAAIDKVRAEARSDKD